MLEPWESPTELAIKHGKLISDIAHSIIWEVHQFDNEPLLLRFIGLGGNHVANGFVESMYLRSFVNDLRKYCLDLYLLRSQVNGDSMQW